MLLTVVMPIEPRTALTPQSLRTCRWAVSTTMLPTTSLLACRLETKVPANPTIKPLQAWNSIWLDTRIRSDTSTLRSLSLGLGPSSSSDRQLQSSITSSFQICRLWPTTNNERPTRTSPFVPHPAYLMPHLPCFPLWNPHVACAIAYAMKPPLLPMFCSPIHGYIHGTCILIDNACSCRRPKDGCDFKGLLDKKKHKRV